MPKLVWEHFEPEVDEVIFSSLSSGQTVTEVCKRIGVGRTTFYDRKRDDPVFAEHVTRACAEGCEALLDECITIADDGTNDYMARVSSDGAVEMVLDREHVTRSKLRIETRMKLLAMKDPMKYGTKVDFTSGGAPIDNMTTVQRATRMEELLAEAEARRLEVEGDDVHP